MDSQGKIINRQSEIGNHPCVIVTGASSGIGEATARRLARAGCRVALAARREAELKRISDEINRDPQVQACQGSALPLRADVTRREEVDRLVQAVVDAWSRIDVLINNAGLSYDRQLVDMPPEKIREEVDVNLLAVIECTQAVLPVMFKQRSGHVINVSSLAGLVALPGNTLYCATKSGVVAFSDSLRREVKNKGVSVTAFCPGFVATPFSPRLRKMMDGSTRRQIGVMSVEYVAGHLTWLISHPRRIDTVPFSWSILVWIANTFPWLADMLVPLVTKFDQKRE